MSETKKIQGDEDPLVDVRTMTDRMMGYFNAVLQLTEDYARMAKRIAELEEELKTVKEQKAEVENEKASVEMKFSEMTKLSADVAKKSSQEALQKALTTFIKKSKNKRIEKRTAVKEMVLELAVANKIVFPEELAAILDTLDDEHTDAKVVHVDGNYNDVHDNSSVRMME